MGNKLACDWGVDVEQIGLGVQNLGGLLDDVQRVFLLDPPLPVEMVPEIGDIWLVLLRFGKELLVCRDVRGWGWDLQMHVRKTRTRNTFFR